MVEAITTPTITPAVMGKSPVPLEHEEDHRQRRADDRGRNRGHANHHQRTVLCTEAGEDHRREIGKGCAEQHTQKKRTAEHAAAKTRADRYRRRGKLGEQQSQQWKQRPIVRELKLDRAVTAAEDLRKKERNTRKYDPADRRPQPSGNADALPPTLRPGHRLHGKDAETGRQHALEREQKIERLFEVECLPDDEKQVGVDKCTLGERRGQRGNGDWRQRADRVRAPGSVRSRRTHPRAAR